MTKIIANSYSAVASGLLFICQDDRGNKKDGYCVGLFGACHEWLTEAEWYMFVSVNWPSLVWNKPMLEYCEFDL